MAGVRLAASALAAILFVGSSHAGESPKGESPKDEPSGGLAIVGVTVVDLSRNVLDGRLRQGVTVVIEDGQIVASGPADEVAVPPGIERVDGTDRFLMAGLWDAHVHTLWDPSLAQTFLPLFVANGVIGVRDMGGLRELALDWPARIEAGELLGPRIVAPGPILDGVPPVHPGVSESVADAEEARRAVQRLADDGLAFAKVYTMLSREAFLAIAEEARRLGLDFAGHPSGHVDGVEAARAGQRSIEHLLHGQPHPGGYLDCLDEDGCADLRAAWVEERTWQVPTLTLLRAKCFSEDEAYAADSRLRYLPSAVREEFEASRRQRVEEGEPDVIAARRRDWERANRWVAELAAAGVPIAAGTDAGVLYSLPGFGLHDELELLVDAGLAPVEALRAATVGVAELLRLPGYEGGLRVGDRADLVLLARNPLEDVGATREIAGVVLHGLHLDRRALDGLLSEVERAASP